MLRCVKQVRLWAISHFVFKVWDYVLNAKNVCENVKEVPENMPMMQIGLPAAVCFYVMCETALVDT